MNTHILPPACRAWMCCAVAFIATTASAQSHVAKVGAYSLRSDTVSSLNLSREAAHEHGIDPSSDTAVLNAVVEHTGPGHVSKTMPAEVRARVTSLSGTPQDVEMKQTAADGYISYTGTFKHLPRQVVDITVTAKPAGSDQAITVKYRERIWPPKR